MATAPESPVEIAIETAVAASGTPFRWNGRDTEQLPGLDCLGLLFRAYGTATGTPWRDYPVDPSKLVASGLLGAPVPGLDGVLREDLDPSLLRRGDVLYFLLGEYEIPDAPLWEHQGIRYWPWHAGLYVDEGHQFALHADPGGIVRHQPFTHVVWDALFVTRPE